MIAARPLVHWGASSYALPTFPEEAECKCGLAAIVVEYTATGTFPVCVICADEDACWAERRLSEIRGQLRLCREIVLGPVPGDDEEDPRYMVCDGVCHFVVDRPHAYHLGCCDCGE